MIKIVMNNLKNYYKILIILVLIICGYFIVDYIKKEKKYISDVDSGNITKVSFHTFNNIEFGLNKIYLATNADLEFPKVFSADTKIKEVRLDSKIYPSIFEKSADPWKNDYVYLVSENKKYCVILSKGPNRKTGNLTLDNTGNIQNTDWDDIYRVLSFNKSNDAKEKKKIVIKIKEYSATSWQ